MAEAPKPRKKPSKKVQSGPPTLTRLWKDRPRIGADNAIHRPGLDGAFFSDLAAIREPVMVQEVYGPGSLPARTRRVPLAPVARRRGRARALPRGRELRECEAAIV